MKKSQNWKGYTSENRMESIDKIKSIISNNEGYILNFNLFSDLAMSMSIEIEESRLSQLHDSLQTVLQMSELEYNTTHLKSSNESLIFLNISFGSGTGNMKIDIPKVPG